MYKKLFLLISALFLMSCEFWKNNYKEHFYNDFNFTVCSLPSPSKPSQVTNSLWRLYPEIDWIRRDLFQLGERYAKHYDKYILYHTDQKGCFVLVAQSEVSDEQLIRAYNIVDFYLSDVSGVKYGSNRSEIANHMAKQKAVLVMPNGQDGDADESILYGQPLYELEFPVEGSTAYLVNDMEERDAGFEEIFHLVHDYGIGTRETPGILKTTYEKEIQAAMENARKLYLWPSKESSQEVGVKNWVKELDNEASLTQEYMASLIDSYYGLWDYEKSEGVMMGLYVAKNRTEMEQKDPKGYELMQNFFPSHLTYMARIDSNFSGTFSLNEQPKTKYSHKSRYLRHVRLTGVNNSHLQGNDQNNILIGNSGNNKINGGLGEDVVQFFGRKKDYNIKRVDKQIIITGNHEGVDTLSNIEILRFADQDLFVVEIH